MSDAERRVGKVAAVLVTRPDSRQGSTRQASVNVSLEGFEGDRHSGFVRGADGRTPDYRRGTPIRNDRQVSLVSAEELEAIALSLGVAEVLPEWLGANLLVQGIPSLTRLPPNTRLLFPGEAVLVVQHENLPCRGPGRHLAARYHRPSLETAFPRAAHRQRGLVACVERAGIIRQGDEVLVVATASPLRHEAA